MPLPIELVLHVVESLKPKYSNVLLPNSHPITQTLLSFTLVCRATRRVANQCLRQHCVHLSSDSRVRSFVSDMSNRQELRKTEAMYIHAWEIGVHDTDFSNLAFGLFSNISSHLRRLVVELPVDYPSHYTMDQLGLFHSGFKLLSNLEEFVSVHDDLFVVRTRPSPWNFWPKLRRLALSGAMIDAHFWSDIAAFSQLETVVLSCQALLDEYNIKALYLAHTQRPLKVLIVHIAHCQTRSSQFAGRKDWDKNDPHKRMTIMTYDVPMLFENEYKMGDAADIVEAYVRTGAENGTLWDWEGDIISHPPVFPPKPLVYDAPDDGESMWA